MTTLRHILAATDLSPSSHRALRRAAQLAAASGARLTVLHVVPLGALDRVHRLLQQDAPAETDRIADSMRRDVQQVAEELTAAYGVTVEVQVPRGTVLEELAMLAESMNADLLVLGAQGMHPVRSWLLGSTTERILRRTTRPVLIVKQPGDQPYRRALIPVDFSAHAVAAVREARSVAPDADLVLAHIAEVPFEGKLSQAGVSETVLRGLHASANAEARTRMDEFLQRLEIGDTLVRTVIERGDVPAVISALETEQACDLVVMGKRGMSLTDELFLGSVTRHVLSRSNADVLVADRDVVSEGDIPAFDA